MISYPFINDFFKNVLSKSKAIGGRFYVCPDNGRELNTDTLGQLLTNALVQNTNSKKYPLALMMPPRSHSRFVDLKPQWKKMNITMFFLNTSFYGNQKITNVNANTQTSLHTVLQDWHDMERAAINFMHVLDKVQKSSLILNNAFRLPHLDKPVYPVSEIGADRASGVRIDFEIELFVQCTLEDYDQADISTITIPSLDSHPEHKL